MTTYNEERKPQGFATMNLEQRTSIAYKGGIAVSRNKAHMAEIGRKGGKASKLRLNSFEDIKKAGFKVLRFKSYHNKNRYMAIMAKPEPSKKDIVWFNQAIKTGSISAWNMPIEGDELQYVIGSGGGGR